jgi:hypothetical protein
VPTGRKDVSLEALTKALGRICYQLRIVPASLPARQQKHKRTG